MKITQTRLKEIIQEELAAVAEAAGHRGNPNKPWDALFPAGGAEEHTPMMPPRESAIAATVGSIINGLRSGDLSAEGAADRLESEVKSKLYKLGLEEGELDEVYGGAHSPDSCPDGASFNYKIRKCVDKAGKVVKPLDEMFDMSGKGRGPGHEASHAEKRKNKKTAPDHEEKMRLDRERKRRLHTHGYEE